MSWLSGKFYASCSIQNKRKRKMKTIKNKTITILIALILMLTIAIPLIALPEANAHTPSWEIPSYAYLVASPNPVGVGQRVAIVMWIDIPMPSASVNNDRRRHDYTLTITEPDENKVTKSWDVVDDTTSIQYYSYTPAKVGTHTLLFEYGGQTYTWSGSYNSDTFLPANKTITLTVQDEPLIEPRTSYPLPLEYWTRPIEGQNTDWWTISSNWLGPPYIPGADAGYGIVGNIQLDGTAPNSPHIMWSRPLQDGGVVGGSSYDVLGKNYYTGGSYNTRFDNALIIQGRLYYELPYGNSGSGGGWICVDLHTGEEIWYSDQMGVSGTGLSDPVFGYIYSYDMYNQHGVTGAGWLFSNNFGTAYESTTGRVATLEIDNVPSGVPVPGPSGELLRFVWNSNGNWLAQWNSSKVFTTQTSGTRDASTSNRYDWNITIAGLGPGRWSINTAHAYTSSNTYNVGVALDNIVLLRQGNLGALGNWAGANITAISLKPESRGQILWTKNYPAAPGNVTRGFVAWDPNNGVFVTEDKETMVLNGWSLTNGEKLWGPTEPAGDYNFFRQTAMIAYGKVYFAGYAGVLYCYDVNDGSLLWTYGNDPLDPSNSTYAGLATAWGHYPSFIDVIADGKIYLGTTEHSPNSPYYKGVRYRCVNATDGTEIWTLMGYGTGMDTGHDVIADGFFVFLNCYDMQVYCVGKGPSATTVTVSPKVSVYGSSVIIEGTVIDIAAGTKQQEQAARFPYGVPAVSDASQSAWMEYVYMQKPRPMDTIGVPIVLSVVDSNGNYRDIGTTTSDADGFFAFNWMPDIEGQYIVYASFAGSESYWPSHAVTSFAVDTAAATPAPMPAEAVPPTDMYILSGVAAIIVAIALVGAVLLIAIKKRP